ncbi:MAG TPA: hypothetical protein VFH33_08910, partial [Candidatus Krumholzibacteria bacterium]|nr:hypothetical protein [Candidatus Krumholzibacteria bacterium]
EINLDVRGASDDRTLADSLRYRIHYVDGDLPFGFTLRPTYVAWNGLNIYWDDGLTWEQEPFSFRLYVTSIDRAGNESKPSNIVSIAHDGDLSDRRELARKESSRDVEFVSRPFQNTLDGNPFTSPPVTRVTPANGQLTIEEYELPRGQKPNSAFLRKYNDTFVRKMLMTRHEWRLDLPVVVMSPLNHDIDTTFTIQGEAYRVGISEAGRRGTRIEVLCEGRPRFESVVEQKSTITYGAWNSDGDHWVIEYPDHVILDGWDLNERHNFQRTFFCQVVAGKPFYFAEVYDKIHLNWGSWISPGAYDEVIDNGAFGPVAYESMVTFYARRGNRWFYVEAGVY